jgi:OPA family glycerol-3-phosphate transporter-like MFS transporter
MLKKLLRIFRPAPHIARLPKDKIDPTYKKLRWQVFAGILIGYVSFYLIRNNFSIAMPHLLQEGFTKTQLGIILTAIPIAYGFSKFFMAIISDRSNPRYFMAVGLVLSAIINFFYGTDVVLDSMVLMFILMFFNGWVQAMGWPASARVMAHWFSGTERGTKMSIWSCAQNVGGGLIAPIAVLGTIVFGSWHSIFYFPAMIALAAAAVVVFLVKDTPQSEGLPPIEEYRHEETLCDAACRPEKEREKELTAKEILFKYVLVNKYLWYLALANIFVYFIRYGVGSWVPTYLKEVKGFSYEASKMAIFFYEYAAIPGIILCGWLSDKLFSGRRAPMCIFYMIGVSVALLVYWFSPVGQTLYCTVALTCIGFFIYGPVVLIGISAVDIAPKKAAGTAAGLTGLLGYVLGTVSAGVGIGWIADHLGWNVAFEVLMVSCILAIVFLTLTWNAGKVKKV